MNLTNYKFIVSSGCSYGVLMFNLHFKHTYLSNVYNTFGSDLLDYNVDKNKLVFLNAGLPSQSSEWALHSVQYTINNLLKLGVKSENIYCFVEWTQYNRISNTTENYIDTTQLEKQNILLGNLNCENLNFLNGFDIGYFKDMSNIGIIDKCSYINSYSLLPSQIEDIFGIHGKTMFDIHNKIYKDTTNVALLKNYFNNIISLQNYLNSNNITYNFCNMQMEFNGWVKFGFEYEQKIKIGNKYQKYYINSNKKIIKNLNYETNRTDGIHVTSAYPQINHLYDMIDFTKWWFHTNDIIQYGGIDDYVLDTYDIYGYSNLMHWQSDEPNVYDIVGGYNWHPTEILYTLLHNIICFNNPFIKVNEKWCNYLTNLLNEDIGYDGISKNKISCSKSYYDKIIIDEYTKL